MTRILPSPTRSRWLCQHVETTPKRTGKRIKRNWKMHWRPRAGRAGSKTGLDDDRGCQATLSLSESPSWSSCESLRGDQKMAYKWMQRARRDLASANERNVDEQREQLGYNSATGESGTKSLRRTCTTHDWSCIHYFLYVQAV
jgi:hypothetical protein